jgi:hypothetical protein
MYPRDLRDIWFFRGPTTGRIPLDYCAVPPDINGERIYLNSPFLDQVDYGGAHHIPYRQTGALGTGMYGLFGEGPPVFSASNYYRSTLTNTGYYGSQWSISAWVYTTHAADGTNYQTVYARGSDVSQSHAMFIDKNGAGLVQFTAAGNFFHTTIGSTVVAANQWHFLVGTYDAAHLTIYLDAVQDGQTAQTLAPQNPTASSGIGVYGASSTANPFIGAIFDSRVYDRALTPAEIATLYASYFKRDLFYEVTLTVPVGGGARSMFAFWMGGGGMVPTTPTTGGGDWLILMRRRLRR